MTDRELLEMAARAAGVRFIKPGDGYDGSLGLCLCDEHNRPICDWNPLTDDGDALRLAVSLNLTVECDFNDSDTCTVTQTIGDIWADESAGMVGEVIGEPDFAATRRAIVRAAAAIGEGME